MGRYAIKHKPQYGWCLAYKGVIWPAYCHGIHNMARADAVDNNPDHRTWEAMYAAGYRLVRVKLSEVTTKRRA